jgi:hypothetical protein
MESVWRDQVIDVVVFGNGESRNRINLQIDPCIKIGCNAMHRETFLDYLVCCDRRMVEEAVNNPQTHNTKIYVRSDWFHYFRKVRKNKNIFVVPELPYQGNKKPDNPDNWGSGGYAILLAASLGFKNILIAGFDLYPVEGKVNNIYKGTNNYSRVDSAGVDYSFWIYQISKIFYCYPTTNFVVAHLPNWKIPADWQKRNVTFREFQPQPLTNLNKAV